MDFVKSNIIGYAVEERPFFGREVVSAPKYSSRQWEIIALIVIDLLEANYNYRCSLTGWQKSVTFDILM